MASSINASTSGGGGIITTADASGNLNIQSGGSTVVAVTSTGATVTGTLAATGASTFTGTGKFATTIGVGNATPAASGSGITFPATQSASSDANTLDDYEEGTWSLSTPTSGYTISSSNGYYTKIGEVVIIYAKVTFSAVNAASNSNVTLSGLPFTVTTLLGIPGAGRDNTTTGAVYSFHVQDSVNTAVLNSMDGINTASQRTIRINESYIMQVTYRI